MWLLVTGGDERDDRNGRARDDLDCITLASSTLCSAERHTTLDPFWRQHGGGELRLLHGPGVGRAFDRPVLRSVFSRTLFQGRRFAGAPLEQALSPIEAVFIPTLSRLQTQPNRYRGAFLQVYETYCTHQLPLYRDVLRAGPSADARGPGAQVGKGGAHFCRFHLLLRSSIR